MLTYPNLCANLCEYRQVVQTSPCIHINANELKNRLGNTYRPKMRPFGSVCQCRLRAGFRSLNQEASFLAFLILNPTVTPNAPELLLKPVPRERNANT